jgi:urease subunit alpha
MFGSFGSVPATTSMSFVSKAAFEKGLSAKLGLRSMVVPVRGCRKIGKKDMIHNDATPDIRVDPETYEVRVDGQAISCDPLAVLPLAQRYFLF